MEEIKKKQYMKWDIFLVGKWNEEAAGAGSITEDMRKTAYKNFYKAVYRSRIIYPQTYKKWFESGSHAVPKRWQILKLALALGLSPEETQEYLTKGISEPEIQVNDYQEFICMYCLSNKLSINDYNEISECFESKIDDNIHFEHTEHTNRLKKEFEELKSFSKVDFTVWMIKNQTLFKGYSMTTYRYFESLIDETIELFRREAEEMLAVKLRETNFYSELNNASELSGKEYRQEVKKYIKNNERRVNNRISEDTIRDIKNYYVMAYSEKGRISVILSEIFNNINKVKAKKKSADKDCADSDNNHPSISAKYISELLNVALQKEKLINMQHAFRKLDRLASDSQCPEDIWKLVSDRPVSPKEAKKLLKRAITMQGQRTKLINRTELLILLSYIIHDRYTLELNETSEEYDMNKAKLRFIKAADSMLTVCGMRPINEDYYLDSLLLACYGEKGIYQFTEVLEML